jgi:hypothetical protein
VEEVTWDLQMTELHNPPARYRTAELVISAVGPVVVIAIMVGVGLLMRHNLNVGMAAALIVSSFGCFAIAAFLALGWIELSIRGRFAGSTLDRIGIAGFTAAGVLSIVSCVVGLLK